MLSSRFLLIPFGLQMFCMAIDEICFHRKRGLPRWERIGHPLDTLTVLLCLLWLVWLPPSPAAVGTYAALATLSCLFVTKDEWVHLSQCRAEEQWLHALLFTLHPLVLSSAGALWPAAHGVRSGLSDWIRYSGNEHIFLIDLCVIISAFGVYQIIYWNLLWRPARAAR